MFAIRRVVTTYSIISFRKMSDKIAGMRQPFHGKGDIFDIDHLHSKNPFKQFEKWFKEATENESIVEPNAMALATATQSGLPSVRMVLMKGFSEETGFLFFTNYGSRKSQELEENPNCSLMFYWEAIKRSVRLEGNVVKVSKNVSMKYFAERPRSSQISATVSPQSQVVASRKVLDEKYAEALEKYGDDKPIDMPVHWGGYNFRPRFFEFWQGQTDRLHDRIIFRRPKDGEKSSDISMGGENGWLIERLAS